MNAEPMPSETIAYAAGFGIDVGADEDVIDPRPDLTRTAPCAPGPPGRAARRDDGSQRAARAAQRQMGTATTA